MGYTLKPGTTGSISPGGQYDGQAPNSVSLQQSAAASAAAAAASATSAAASAAVINLTAPGPIGSTTPSTGAFTTLSASGDVTLSSGVLKTDTTDGSDSKYIAVSGGGALSAGRGAYLIVYGNENAGGGNNGDLQLSSGNAAGSAVKIAAGSGNVATISSTGLAVTGTLSATGGIEATSAASDAIVGLLATGVQRWQLKTERSTGNFLLYNQTGATTPITVSTTGNLGIGSAPGAFKLDVASTANQLRLINSTGNAERLAISTNASGTVFSSYNTATTTIPFVWKGYSTELMRLDASGNLGLGVTPSAWSTYKALEIGRAGNAIWANPSASETLVSSGITYVGGLWTYPVTATYGAAYYSQTNGVHKWASAASAAHTAGDSAASHVINMTLDANGHLGVGVVPSAWTSGKAISLSNTLSLFCDGTASYHVNNLYYNGGWKYKTTAAAAIYAQPASGAHEWYTIASGTVDTAATVDQRMRLDINGNLGVGITPVASTAILQAKNATASTIGGVSAIAGFQATTTGHFSKLTLGTDTGSGLAGVAAKALTYGAGGAYPNNVGSLIGFTQNLGSTTFAFEVGSGTTFALEGANSAAGTGIAFPATQLASSNANTLDDYEEGTFTPTITFGGASVGMTYTLQMGRYTKIGNRVHYSLFVALSAKGSSTGALKVGGLPLTSYATANTYSVPSVRGAAGAASLTGYLQGHVEVNATTMALEKFTAGAASAITDVDTTATTSFIISGTYEAA